MTTTCILCEANQVPTRVELNEEQVLYSKHILKNIEFNYNRRWYDPVARITQLIQNFCDPKVQQQIAALSQAKIDEANGKRVKK
jgi:hypothetical protein